ncbi:MULTISPECIES: hypothetical protein [unclassified Corallococcus]|uniref:hypothetical protein n=1 Tax=unclassified Corallococcus TaxID=2685029 RepID=UPI001A8C8913|nr:MULTISPECIES: hypothetical protein [unclassified Corallococcus]MBN9687090.1 hypothetical protein [Corallococcus sp. NCSPR001]WAS89081.1 hypothetical protein O0N60_19370 [Corallococcus sp. NCRR]
MTRRISGSRLSVVSATTSSREKMAESRHRGSASWTAGSSPRRSRSLHGDSVTMSSTTASANIVRSTA